MNRRFLNTLIAWKMGSARKPILLKGARQVGKTYLLKEFGKAHFQKCHYFNFEKQKNLQSIFTGGLIDPKRVIEQLEILYESKINLREDLVFFDEIQECPEAITSLKYFNEEFPTSFICAAGSLLGVALSSLSFPVGQVQLEQLFPMDFSEFLNAYSEPLFEEYQRTEIHKKILPQALHEKFLDSFYHYLAIGGMPEIVAEFLKNREDVLGALEKCRKKQNDLIQSYLSDISKHSGSINAMHIKRVWEDIPRQLGKDSSKFVFKNVIPGKKSFKEIEKPLDWVENAGLAHKVYIINEAQIPLKAYVQHNSFKLYLHDVGLLSALSEVPITLVNQIKNKDLLFKGVLYENFVLQQLKAIGSSVYCWQGKSAEVEFLIQKDEMILPLEVKSSLNNKAKSLKVFIEKYNIENYFIVCPDVELSEHKLPIYLIGKTEGTRQ